MKRIYKVYKKTVSIVNETPTAMYENLVRKQKGISARAQSRTMTGIRFGGTGGTDLLGGGVACHHKKERGARRCAGAIR